MSDILAIYIYFVLLLFVVGVVVYMGASLHGDASAKRTGARVILASPVWPLALVLVLVKALLYWVPRIWREAWS